MTHVRQYSDGSAQLRANNHGRNLRKEDALDSRSGANMRITIFAGTALLIGILGTPLPTAANWGATLCQIVTFGQGCSTPFGTSIPDPQLVPTTCTPPKLGVPQFLHSPKGTARYPFNGICTSPERPGAQMRYSLEGSWFPSETDLNKPNATESFTMAGYEPFMPDRAPGGSIFMYWTARCKNDPWLQPEDANCRLIGTYIPDDLRQAVPELLALNFPKTDNMIASTDRQRLRMQYLRLNSPIAGTKRIPGVMAPTPDMFTIKNPTWNAVVQQGQLFLKADPPKIGATPVTELEFHWLDAPPNHPATFNRFVVDTPQLVQGFLVDPRVTRANIGRYEVRVRSSGKAVPGPWSFPVMFKLFLTQPTQSQRQSSPIQQTAPFPSSAVTAPSTIQQPAPLPPPSVMQPLPPSSAPAQMNRSPFVVRPRGVEEKGGKPGSETVDISPGLEKKP